LYALLIQGIRHLRTMRVFSLQFGVALSRAIVLLLVLDTGSHLARGNCDPQWWACGGDSTRAAFSKKLQQLPGKHLVIVGYAELHKPHNEWVYNGADIDGAKVVWARDMGPAQNEKLVKYFKDRQVWKVTDDGSTRSIDTDPVTIGGQGAAKELSHTN
jgi:hypothetical protein